MTTRTIKNVEVLAVGEWNGIPFNTDDLHEVVRAFDDLSLAGRSPVKLGHEARDTEPAQGWIKDMRVVGDKIVATLTQVPEELCEEIKEGRWRHVSIELLRDVTANGEAYKWVPCGLAILGSARPAVDVLRPLHELMARALPRGIRFRERVAFSQAPAEVETLRAELKRMNRDAVQREFDDAIKARRILPRDRHAFEVRMGQDASLEEARKWIAQTPRPATFSERPAGRSADSRDRADDSKPDGSRPDVEMARLVAAEVERSGGKLGYLEAQRLVFKQNPELGESYRLMPGTKEH